MGGKVEGPNQKTWAKA